MPPETPNEDLEDRIRDAIANPKNMGEMTDADAVGTVGSSNCGDMVRMWLKFKEKDGRKIIDRASFQSFGCQTAIAVASVATELLAGKSVEEALALEASDLSKPLGALPPMKIHCGQMVEGALRQALEADRTGEKGPETAPTQQGTVDDSTLLGRLSNPNPDAPKGGKLKIVKLDS
ncbi:MAG: iron-sulfur cluster assembly scaffold protein [Verrucomicrobiae bacterium]|nr:iron-sulfur cluster assembly scaffold protein [Verrucomicrobiae bacterium]MCP5541067.1 iron-sulfur cluster assembly scaffold protein [Akkermansiaceae bacterium]